MEIFVTSKGTGVTIKINYIISGNSFTIYFLHNLQKKHSKKFLTLET